MRDESLPSVSTRETAVNTALLMRELNKIVATQELSAAEKSFWLQTMNKSESVEEEREGYLKFSFTDEQIVITRRVPMDLIRSLLQTTCVSAPAEDEVP